jgi:8-oxo-dGTP diphosphatase
MADSREYPSRPICSVGVVALKRGKDDAVLLIRRGNPPRRGGWGLPGGVVELGETWRETARREVREECGIEIAVGDVIDAVDIILRDDQGHLGDAGRVQYHFALVDFAAAYVRGDVRAASDVLDARWVLIADLTRSHCRKRRARWLRRRCDRRLLTADHRPQMVDGGQWSAVF